MKKIFFIAGLMAVGLFANSDARFTADDWIPSGPTEADIRASSEFPNSAMKGSREDKFIRAAKSGDLKNVEILITAGANIEARDNEGMTALMFAAEKGYSNIAQILIDAGAEISAQDKFGCTAFFRAADNNHVDIVKMLIAKGAAADSCFEDIFVSCVSKGNTEMVNAFMAERARIKDDAFDTAYMIASGNRRRNPELFSIFEKIGRA